MSEFANRISAQRQLLKVINKREWHNEELLSLSRKAINRWTEVNVIDQNSKLVNLIITASQKLFFLANKSQEQVSTEYKETSFEIERITKEIETEVAAF